MNKKYSTEEIKNLLKTGEKVRNINWGNNIYIKLYSDNKVRFCNNKNLFLTEGILLDKFISYIFVLDKDQSCFEWEIYIKE